VRAGTVGLHGRLAHLRPRPRPRPAPRASSPLAPSTPDKSGHFSQSEHHMPPQPGPSRPLRCRSSRRGARPAGGDGGGAGRAGQHHLQQRPSHPGDLPGLRLALPSPCRVAGGTPEAPPRGPQNFDEAEAYFDRAIAIDPHHGSRSRPAARRRGGGGVTRGAGRGRRGAGRRTGSRGCCFTRCGATSPRPRQPSAAPSSSPRPTSRCPCAPARGPRA